MRLGRGVERISAKADAAIRVETAQARLAHQSEVNQVKVLRQRLDLVELEEQARTIRATAAAERQAIERKRVQTEKDARRERWKALRERFVEALSDRSVLALVAFAVVTAWVGQATSIHEDFGMPLPVAVAGATALELTGIALLRKLGQASARGARALRMRVVIWGVIAFAAWANWSHFGVVMAGMSVLGPAVWEVSKWWEARRRLYDDGSLRRPPLRPRFPLDHCVLFPRDTWAAYRVAVRDEIGDPRIALAVARGERARRDLDAELREWRSALAAAMVGLVARLDRALAATQTVRLDRDPAPTRRVAVERAKSGPVSGKRKRVRADRAEVMQQARAALERKRPPVLDGPWVLSVVKGPVSAPTARRVADDLRKELQQQQDGPHLVGERSA